MALHAIDDLSDAFDATRSFLFPFDWGRWLRLALLAVFVGSSGGGASLPSNTFQYSVDTSRWANGPDVFVNRYPNFWLYVAVAVLVVIAVALVLSWIAATFEFVFLESIRSETVHVREYFGLHGRKGTHLFVFRLVFGIVMVLGIGGLALLALSPVILGGNDAWVLLFLLVVPILVVVGLLAAIAFVFTTAFVAPIMVIEDRGVLDAWRRFWGVLRGHWEQFVVFAVVGVIVSIVIGIAVGIVIAVLAILIAIPFGVVAAALFLGAGGTMNVWLIALLGIPFALLLIVVVALAEVPVQSYYRYWALFVLGDVDPDLDLIPDQRAAVRAEDEASA